jgi:AcrR family transcriptional regulator
MKRERKKPTERKEHILAAACTVAAEKGYNNVTREDTANEAGVSMSLVSHYFKTMPQLRRDIMRYAVRERIDHVIAQGLMHKDPQALKVDKETRNRVLHSLAEQ